MGPRDPFDNAAPEPDFEPQERFASYATHPDEPVSHIRHLQAGVRGISIPTVGFLLGFLFGILLLLFGFSQALLVLLLGGLGGGVAWLGHGLVTGRFDLAAAWQALRRR